MRKRGFGVLIGPIAFLWLSRLAAADGFSWQEESNKYVDLLYNGKPALRYMHQPLDESSEESRAATMKVYHHVWTPDGTALLTKGPGGLYPHHRGLFYGFNKITYGDGQEADTWHCNKGEWQAHVKELARHADAKSARHAVAVDWHGRDGKPFAREERTLAVRRGNSDDAEGWIIDFASSLTPAEGIDVIHLDGDPQHAGFQFRASQHIPDKSAKQTYYLRPDGKGKEGGTRNWDHARPDAPDNKQSENLPWNAMSVVLDGDRYTVVYLDHPSNPKPARYSERDYGRFGSYFVADATQDKPLAVQYRLWIQPGEMTVDQCQRLHDQFVN